MNLTITLADQILGKKRSHLYLYLTLFTSRLFNNLLRSSFEHEFLNTLMQTNMPLMTKAFRNILIQDTQVPTHSINH